MCGSLTKKHFVIKVYPDRSTYLEVVPVLCMLDGLIDWCYASIRLHKFCTQKKKYLGFCYNSNDRHQSLILYAISVVHLQLSHSFLGQVNHGASEVVHCTCVNMQRQFQFNSTSHPIYLRYSLSGQQTIGIKDCYCHSDRNLDFYFFFFFSE